MKNIMMKILVYILWIMIFFYSGYRMAEVEEKMGISFSIGIEFLIVTCMLVHFLIHTILHEAGHMVGGLCTGYKFSSFRIGSIVWIKNKEQKIEVKRMKIPGTAGQCLMCPPDVETEKCPYKLYHLMGGLTNIALGVIALVIAVFLPQNLITFLLFDEFGVVGLLLGTGNLLPFKTKGISNDGYNMRDLKRNSMAKKCINLVLSLNAELTLADSYNDISEKVVNELKTIDFTKEDISNSSIANAFSEQVGLLYVDGKYEQAYELNKYIVKSKEILPIFKNEANCECLFYEIMNGEAKEIIENRFDKKLKSYVKATAIYPSRQRLMYAYYKLYAKDDEKAEKYMKQLEKSVKTFFIKANAKHEWKVAKEIKKITECKDLENR